MSDAQDAQDSKPASPADYTEEDNAILPPSESTAAKVTSPKPSEIAVHDTGSSRSWWIPGGMLAAAGAAIVVWWVWPPSEEIRNGADGQQIAAPAPEPSPLPSYVLETDDAEPHRYRRSTRFRWILRPESAAEGEVAVRGFAFVDGGSAGLPLELGPVMKIEESGAIALDGEIVTLGLEPGRYTIALVVGRPGALPEQAGALAGEGASAWEIRRVEIEILD